MGTGAATRRQVGGGRLPDPSEPSRGTSQRRIREDARDGAYVMLFTGLASTVTALSFVLLARLAG